MLILDLDRDQPVRPSVVVHGPVQEWDTRVDNALEFACRVAGRDLTEAEWTEQFGVVGPIDTSALQRYRT